MSRVYLIRHAKPAQSFGQGWVRILALALLYVLLALGLNIVVGYAGLLDLGYVAFYAVGAYTVGWFMSSFYADANIHILVSGAAENLPGIHVNFLIVLVVAAGLCALAGILIGLPTLRLRGDYLAIVTIASGRRGSASFLGPDPLGGSVTSPS